MNSIITQIYDQVVIYTESMNKRPPAILITREQEKEIRASAEELLMYHVDFDNVNNEFRIFGILIVVEGNSATALDFRRQTPQ